MNTWNMMKHSFETFYYHSNNAKYINNGCDIFLNKTKNMSMCSVFIDNYFNFNLNPIEDIDCSGYIYAFPQHKNKLFELSNNTKLIRSATIMTCDIQNMPKLMKNNDIEIKLVSDSLSNINDYIEIICSLYKITVEEAKIIFDLKQIIASDDIYIFCAYMKNKPIGFLEAVKKDNQAFVIAAYVINEYRNTKILTSLGMYAIDYAIDRNVKKYSALAGSEFSIKLMSSIGFLQDIPCDIWVFNK